MPMIFTVTMLILIKGVSKTLN